MTFKGFFRKFKEEMLPGDMDAMHAHEENQLLFSLRGVILVGTENGKKYLVPPLRALWLPAGQRHELRFLTKTSTRCLFFEATENQFSDIRVLEVTPLLSELFKSSFDEALQTSTQKLIAELILSLFSEAKPITSSLAMPSNEVVLSQSKTMILENKWNLELSDFAQKLHMEKTTFARQFKKETGLSFREWKKLVRVCTALDLLCSGLAVKQVALRLQYASASNFIDSFKEIFGQTPGKFLNEA